MTEHNEQQATIAYKLDTIRFDCTNCGGTLTLTKRSPHVEVSGIFCQTCKVQYYMHWESGVLRRVNEQ
jgi:hypothetical protein